jgi:hypothetical protein
MLILAEIAILATQPTIMFLMTTEIAFLDVRFWREVE